jgi:hypothetical protein
VAYNANQEGIQIVSVKKGHRKKSRWNNFSLCGSHLRKPEIIPSSVIQKATF